MYRLPFERLKKNETTSARWILRALIPAIMLLAAIESRAATITVTSAADSGPGTLRQCLLNANTSNGIVTVAFQIPGAGAHVISPLSALPAITAPMVIDGTTQFGYAGKPLIQLDGSSAGANAGLQLQGGNSMVRGLAISHFAANGMVLASGTNVIQGNFIGTDTNGTIVEGNSGEGILIMGASGNLVGGTNASQRNLISGNTDAGVYALNGGTNTVEGNFIGTTVAGTGRLGNGNHGIVLYNSAGNAIGGSLSGAGNLVSGNGGSGVYLVSAASAGNLVRGNFIGTDLTGSGVISNAADGVTAQGAPNNVIGGASAGTGNLISGNGGAGVFLDGAGTSGNLVQGNFIGTDQTGKLGRGNFLAGVTMLGATNNQIGGYTAGAGNVISGNQQDGILITTNSSGNLVVGNYLGTDATGSNSLGNHYDGVAICGAATNFVGGTSAGAGNVVSANGYYGVYIFAGSSGNLVQGNLIGPSLSGRTGLTNRLSGVRIESPANTIGGTTPGARNVISANGQDGIMLVGSSASGNLAQGNYIGTTVDGTSALGNGLGGVGISGAPGNTIGGAAAGAGNLISANGDAAIYLVGAGAAGNLIQGNTNGTDGEAMNALGNFYEGLYLEGCPSNVIGGTVIGAGNLMSGNHTRGVFLTNASWNVIQGNWIGIKGDGASGLGNVFHGIECGSGSYNNTIGGAGMAGNRIGFSQTVYAGVRVRAGSTNNAILGNSIFSNGGLGIDLGNYGVTPNVPCNSGTGANMGQNYPVLSSAISGNGTLVSGSLNSRPGATYLIQFFADPAADPQGFGQGHIYLGQWVVTTSNNCNASFETLLPADAPPGYFLCATATDPNNNTSEFSADLPVTTAPALSLVSVMNGQMTLGWSNSPGGFVLKETGSLSPPIQWTAVTNAPFLTNGVNYLPFPVGTGNKFFVLSHTQ